MPGTREATSRRLIKPPNSPSQEGLRRLIGNENPQVRGEPGWPLRTRSPPPRRETPNLDLEPNSLSDLGGLITQTTTNNQFVQPLKSFLLLATFLAAMVCNGSVISLGDALEQPTQKWLTDGDSKWFGQADDTNDGIDALQCTALGGRSHYSYLHTTVSGGPMIVGFLWKQDNGLILRFFVDGVLWREYEGALEWRKFEEILPPGVHRLRWEVTNKADYVSGSVFLDQVSFIPLLSLFREPESQRVPLHSPVLFRTSAFGFGTEWLQFQWYKDGNPIEGATHNSLYFEKAEQHHAGAYSVTVSDGMETRISSNAVLTITVIQEAVECTNMINSDVDTNWFTQTNITHDGVDAAQCGDLRGDERGNLFARITGPGLLTFWWKVSSEQQFDTLTVYVPGASPCSISGEVDWERKAFWLPPGDHYVVWYYAKNAVFNSGMDAAWVDEITFIHSEAVAAIVAQPADVATVFGQPATLSVQATGTQPLSYQWRKNGVDIPGATHSSYSLENTGSEDEGFYCVAVSNQHGRQLSSKAHLNVTAEPETEAVHLLTAEINEGVSLADALDTVRNVTTGGDVPWFGQANRTSDGIDAAQSGVRQNSQKSTFEMTVEGPGTFSFWWKVSSEEGFDKLSFSTGSENWEISGEKDWRKVEFQLEAYRYVLSWQYSKDASVSVGADSGWVDQIQFVQPPYLPFPLVADPLDYGSEGASLVVDAKGTPPLSYQWYQNDVEIPGATNSDYRIENVQTQDTGFYFVIVRNAYGSAVSSRSCLRSPVSLEEALDTTGWQWQLGNSNHRWIGQFLPEEGIDAATFWGSVGGALEATFTTTSAGTLNFSYKTGTEYQYGDFRLFVLDNDRTIFLDSGKSWKRESVELAAGTHHLKWYSHNGGPMWVDNVNFVPAANRKPTILEQPSDQLVGRGGSASFSVLTSGNPRPVYQWRFLGRDLPGETNATLALTNVSDGSVGRYSVLVSNTAGSTLSAIANLALRRSTNNLGIMLDYAKEFYFNYETYERRLTELGISFQYFTNVHEAVREKNILVFPLSWEDPRFTLVSSSERAALANFVAVGNTIIVLGWTTRAPAFLNSVFDFAVVQGYLNGASATRTPEALNTPFANAPFRRPQETFLHRETLPAGSQIIYRSEKGVSTTLIPYGDGRIIYADAFDLDLLPYLFDVATPSSPSSPQIRLQPQSRSVPQGRTTTLRVEATGSRPLHYQWRRNGIALASQTNSSLTLFDVTSTNSGPYSAEISNVHGATITSDAVVNVIHDDFAEALDTHGLTWTAEGTHWHRQSEQSHDSIDALQSGAVSNGQTSTLQTKVRGPGVLSFWWKLSAGASHSVQLFIDETPFQNISGEQDWQKQSLFVPSGTHAIRWIYKNDWNEPDFEAAWLDEVKFGDKALWWHHSEGHLAKWYLSRTNLVKSVLLNNGVAAPADWKFGATAPVHWAGATETVLWLKPTRTMESWLMNDNWLHYTLPVGTSFGYNSKLKALTTGWSIVSATDFNRDSYHDLLLQHDDGRLAVSYLNIIHRDLTRALIPIPPSWRVVGTADLDRDGHKDIVFRNVVSRRMAVRYMNRGDYLRADSLRNAHQVTPGWEAAGLADMDDNGSADILFQHSDGRVAAWLMEGPNFLRTTLLANGRKAEPGWKLVGPK